MMPTRSQLLLLITACLLFSASPSAGRDYLLLQSTTSTQNSGLYDQLLPAFTAQSGIEVRVVAVGTGQALKNAENCDADLLIVHARDREEAFVAAGFGLTRHDLMHNDFVIVGPADDPAGIAGQPVNDALRRIAEGRLTFISRGDDSGTHIRERQLWTEALAGSAQGLTAPDPRSGWYKEVGAGMGATLNIAVELGGYSFSDRSTWQAFGNKRQHRILVEGDPRLFNPYSVIVVNPAHCPNVQLDKALAFQDWLLSPAGKAAINGFAPNGEQLFFAAP